MKTVNITDIPLFSKDNISTAIRVAEVLYPDGVHINFPVGTYRTGIDYPINVPSHTKLVGNSAKYDKYDIIFGSSLSTTGRWVGRSKYVPGEIIYYPGLESYRNLRNRKNGLNASDPQYSALRECYLDNIWIAPNDAIPFRRNQLIGARAPYKKPPVPSISWIEFLKSF